MSRLLPAIVCLLAAPGCIIVQVGVTNPVPGLSTVAVAPFFNLSSERAVDGRRFALAYFAELQKVPGFQVVPVGVTEQAIFENQLEMNNPDDVLRLARLLGVDAVVVGAVTDYDPYYPPRIGLQVSWFSLQPWTFSPGVPIDPAMQDRLWDSLRPPNGLCKSCQGLGRPCSNCHQAELRRKHASRPVVRGQSEERSDWYSPTDEGEPSPPVARMSQNIPLPDVPPFPPPVQEPPDALAAPPALPPQVVPWFDPRQPFMSYTRVFDGADADLVAALRDYVELSGDLRSGGWEGYLHRSDDFIRFTAHRMIVEMLMLHGGEAKRRFVFTPRKQK